MEKKLVIERSKLLRSVEKLLEGPMIFLGFVWLILLVIELLWGLNQPLEYISLGIWAVFIFDFLLKLFLAPDKLAFFKSNWLTAISLIIPALRVFRVLRLLRVFRSVRLVKVVASLNRSIRSLGATMTRRGFGYVMMITLIVTFAGAAGMHALEKTTAGFENYGMSLWWTAMRVITAGNEFNPVTAEGRALGFLIAVFGYTIFGYVTASFASYFVGRDAEEKNAPVAGSKEVEELKGTILHLVKEITEMKTMIRSSDAK